MSESNESDLDRLKRYIKECKTCAAEEGVEAHIAKLKNIIDKYPPEKLKKMLRAFKALGNPIRLKILFLLLEKEDLCPCELNITFELSQSNISHHLNILERAELISNYTRGKWKYYRITETGKELMKFI
jgi:DNA-binding transcriptional ArsR family regulator